MKNRRGNTEKLKDHSNVQYLNNRYSKKKKKKEGSKCVWEERDHPTK